jgi:hypothetical protein
MVTNYIDLELLEQKTSPEFVKEIKNTVEHVNTWDEKEIQFYIDEDQYSLTVLMCFYGSIEKLKYWFSVGTFDRELIYWTDIRKFFNIPLEMKKIKKVV